MNRDGLDPASIEHFMSQCAPYAKERLNSENPIESSHVVQLQCEFEVPRFRDDFKRRYDFAFRDIQKKKIEHEKKTGQRLVAEKVITAVKQNGYGHSAVMVVYFDEFKSVTGEMPHDGGIPNE